MLEINRIHQGDCLDLLDQLDDNSIDLVVTSPPYAVSKGYERRSAKKSYVWMAVWLSYQCFKKFARVVKPGGYIFWNFGDSGMGKRALGTQVTTTIPMAIWYWKIGQRTGFELQATRVWSKNYSATTKSFVQQIQPRPCFDYEHLWTYRKPDETGKQVVRERKVTWRGVWSYRKDDLEAMGIQRGYHNLRKSKAHGAAFPEYIPACALTAYSDEGSVVLDPFLGTGTTAVVCERMNRNWIGFERDPSWVEFANSRIEEARNPKDE